MTTFNPDFWEVTVEASSWEQYCEEDGLWHESAADSESRRQRSQQTHSLWSVVRPILDQILTARQLEVVSLYFFGELNQRQIAEPLGLSQQAVSEHLYGKVRNGRSVGGALRKLRKVCATRGVHWE